MEPIALVLCVLILVALVLFMMLYLNKRFRVILHRDWHCALTRLLVQRNFPVISKQFEVQTISGEMLSSVSFYRNEQLNFTIRSDTGGLYHCTNYMAFPFFVRSVLDTLFITGQKVGSGVFTIVQIPTDEHPQYPQNPYALLKFVPAKNDATS